MNRSDLARRCAEWKPSAMLEEIKSGAAVTFKGAAGQPIPAWGGKGPTPDRAPRGNVAKEKRGGGPKKAYRAHAEAGRREPAAPPQGSRRLASLAPWLIVLLWLLLIALSRTTGPGWLPAIRL